MKRSRYMRITRGIVFWGTCALAASAVAQPVLEVRVDSVIYPSGSDVALPDVDFGNTGILIVVLRSLGNQNLVFNSAAPVELSTATPDAFAVIQPPLETGNQLSPNGSTAWRLDFSPSGYGLYEATATIASNDPNSPHTIRFFRNYPAPNMVVRIDSEVIPTGTPVSHGYVATGSLRQVIVVLRNEGAGILQFVSTPPVSLQTTQTDALSLVQPPLESGNKISPNGSTAFIVRMEPTIPGLVSGKVSIETNDPASPFELRIAGMGVGSNGESDLCAVPGSLQSEYEGFLDAVGASTDDLDGDGLPDHLSLSLLQHGGCQGASGMSDAFAAAYESNLLALALEDQADEMAAYRRGLAAAMATSASLHLAAKSALAGTNISLEGDYTSATCTGNDCSPERVDLKHSLRALNEPCSGAGDFDQDGATNLEEWQHVLARGGNANDFLAAATDPTSDGTLPRVPTGCSAKSTDVRSAGYPVEIVLGIGLLLSIRLARRKK